MDTASFPSSFKPDLSIEDCGNLMIVLSFDYKILDINRGALALHDWTKEAVIGKNYVALCKEQGIDVPLEGNLATIRAGDSVLVNEIFTVDQKKADGQYKHTTSFSYRFRRCYDASTEAQAILVSSINERSQVDLSKGVQIVVSSNESALVGDNKKDSFEAQDSAKNLEEPVSSFADSIKNPELLDETSEILFTEPEGGWDIETVRRILREVFGIKSIVRLFYVLYAVKRAPGSVYIKTEDGHHLFCNDFALKVLGVSSANELENVTDEQLCRKLNMPEKDIQTIRNNDKMVFDGQSIYCAIETLNIEGLLIYFFSNKALVIKDNEKVKFLVGVSTYTQEPKDLFKAMRFIESIENFA